MVFTFKPVQHLSQKRKQRRRRKCDAKEKKNQTCHVSQAVKTKSNRNEKSSRIQVPLLRWKCTVTYMHLHQGWVIILRSFPPDRAAILSKYRRTMTGFILDV